MMEKTNQMFVWLKGEGGGKERQPCTLMKVIRLLENLLYTHLNFINIQSLPKVVLYT